MNQNLQPDFNKFPDGLVPCIIQDAGSGKVLMLGYMNRIALQKTAEINKVTFYSRSRQRLWTKGEESGNFLTPAEIRLDCDGDTLLIKVKPAGPVCHTGADTCFNEINTGDNFLASLQELIQDRKNSPDADSYVRNLFEKGINKIAQKVGEEAVELVIEAKDDNIHLFKEEAADLFFHYLVLLNAKGVKFEDIMELLQERHARRQNNQIPQSGT